ncbi:MAG TPA: penicillin-binding protein activator [Rhodanobacteraceae bacterium]|nr:penicillin-binding protein activator [Rhodanobacteraceae bacterium]
MHARFRQGRPLAAALLALALAACATIGEEPPAEPSADAAKAEQLYRHGDLDQAAAAFEALAASSGGDTAAHYRLRAAESLRDAGDLDGAARALGDLKRRRLHGADQIRLDLLDAEIALAHGDFAQAEALLAAPVETLPEDLRPRALELRARAEVAKGDRYAAARSRAELDRYLSNADRDQNRKEIIDTLAALDAGELKQRAEALRPDDPLRPWIEQALRSKGEALARALPRPSRPVGTIQAGQGGSAEPEGYAPPQHVALLLPLGAQLAAVSQSIRDGFLAAYFASDEAKRPDVRIYDAGKTPADAVAAYDAAVADGADRVVGPLQREAVGELFHHDLSTPVLALNHPDTGEIPPAGSAEFGLLPDSEGAQVADHMRERGIARAAVITAEADWAERAALAFRAQFEASGGTIVGEARLRDSDVNYKTAIVQATGTLGDAPDAGVFISMRPQQARLLLPQLKVASIAAPVFGTSHVYSGDANPGLDRDLDGVEFCDAPWLFGPVPGRPDRDAVSRQLASANGVGARLFAFGMDAYALLPFVDWLLAHPDSYLDGATGDLAADSFGRIHRLVGWARFSGGIARAADGALSEIPDAQ